MTVAGIHLTIQSIRDLADDDEVAHGMEYDLWESVLRAIAAGAGNPQELAAAALETKGIEFQRWRG